VLLSKGYRGQNALITGAVICPKFKQRQLIGASSFADSDVPDNCG
jgi:hypothetical protein